jgi:hypothetical protein
MYYLVLVFNSERGRGENRSSGYKKNRKYGNMY